MTRRKRTAVLLALALLLSFAALEALASSAGSEPVCFTPTAGYPSHDWGGWKIIQKATCKQTGQRVRVCERCGEKQTETIKKTAHQFGGWKVTQKATCKQTGQRVRVCEICGEKQTETIKKTAHQFGSWKVTKKATCKQTGQRVRVCEICGEKQTQTIEKTAHQFGDWQVTREATCTKTGRQSRVCALCGEKETKKTKINPNAHAWGEWQLVSPVTPDALGMKRRVCTLCGKTEEQVIAWQGEAGLTLTAGKMTRLEPAEGYTDLYSVEMTLQNTGAIPLRFAIDATYGNGSSYTVITDDCDLYDSSQDHTLQPGAVVAFQYVVRTSLLEFDGDRGTVSRLVRARGWSEETGQQVNATAPILINLPAESGLQLTVENLHRTGQGANEVLTFDLRVTNGATGFSVITASASNDLLPLTDQEGFINWPSDGLVLGWGQSHMFGYSFQPTAQEYAKGQEHEVLAWISRYITVQDTQGHSDTVCLCARMQTSLAVDAHLDGAMEVPEYLSLHQVADLPATLTLTNISNQPITDPVVKGVLTAGGKTLHTYTLSPENGVSVLQPQESAAFALTAAVGPGDESAAMEEEDALLRFVFWAEYGYVHPEEGTVRAESNQWQQSIPVWDQEYDDPKSTYVMPVLTGSFDESVHHPGDRVWIDLTVENVNPTDTVQGIRFEWYSVDEKGDVTVEPVFTIDMPDVILMPGESYTLKHRFSFGVDQEEALKGQYILDFHAWCHSVTYDWYSNCAWSGLIRMEPDEEKCLSVDVTFDPGKYYVVPLEVEGAWQTVEEVQGAPGFFTGDVSGHTGDPVTYPTHAGTFSASVNVNNDSDEAVEVAVTSDHAGDLLNGQGRHQAVIPPRGSLLVDYEIEPTEEETQAGLLTRTVSAVSLDGALTEQGVLSFTLRDGGWHLDSGWPGLAVTAGEVTQLWNEDGSETRFMADVTVENTGDIPLSLFVESRDGGGVEAWEDYFEGWGDGVDVTSFQPGEAFTFQYVMKENAADRMDGFLHRTLNVGGLVEETEAYVTGSASFQFPVIRKGALVLTVNGHHRSVGADQTIAVDLTLTSAWEDGDIPVVISAQDEKGNAPSGDSLVDWPQGGTVSLSPGTARSFGYVIRPTQEEIDAGEVERMIIADGGEEPFLDYVRLTYPLVSQEGQTALVHLEGSMQSGTPLALYDAFEAYLTATNLGNVPVEDVIIHGTAQSADGKTLAQLTLGAGGSGLVTAPGEGVQAFPCFPVTPEMAVAALAAHGVNEFAKPGTVTFTFWAQYTRRYGDGWVVPGVSNLVSFTVPIAEDTAGGILLTGLGSALPHPQEGDPVDIHLVVENKGKEDLVGLRLDVQRRGIGGFSFLQTLINEPLDIIHPGETRPYDFHYAVTDQDEDAGFYGFKFVASSESGIRPMMYVSTFEYAQLLLPEETEETGGTVLIAKRLGNLPPNGQTAFQLNDAIHYTVELTNTYAFPVTNIAVYDHMTDYTPLLLGTVDLESGQTKSISFTHPVTALDEANQKVENIAQAQVLVSDPQTGEILEDYSVWSNVLLTPVETANEEDDEGIALKLKKTVANQPKVAQGYQEGETVVYDITVYNGHSIDAEIALWDHVWGDEAPELVDEVTLSPGETRSFTHQHVVNKDDVADGSVINEAYAGVMLRYSEDENDVVGYTAWAEPVTVPTIPTVQETVTDTPPTTDPPVTPPVTESKLIPPETGSKEKQPGTTPAPPARQPGEGDECCRVLTGYGVSTRQYALIFCAQHLPVEMASRELPFPEARAAWIRAVEDAYTALAQKVPDAASLLQTEQTLFFDQLACHEALLALAAEEDLAESLVLQQLRERCLDLCCALHAVPHTRADSVLLWPAPVLPFPNSLAEGCSVQRTAVPAGYQVEETVCRDHVFIHSELHHSLTQAQETQTRAQAFRRARALWLGVLLENANRLYPSLPGEGKAALADDLNQFLRWVQAREAQLLTLYSQDLAEEMLADSMRSRAVELEMLSR